MRVKMGMVSVGACVGGFVGVNYLYRPIPDSKLDPNGPFPRESFALTSSESLPDLVSKKKSLPWPLRLCQRISGFLNVSFFRFYMNVIGGRVRVVKNENYVQFLAALFGRDENASLVTVSNHRSMADDPGVISCIVPYFYAIQPKYIRWSLCAQDYCFNEKFPAFVYGLCGSFKVLPMWRGGGVNQKLLLDFARLSFAGEWLHVFPEGGVWQQETLGGRKVETMSHKGKLKWGIGKVIAHSLISPIVIPFHISGSEHIVPQNNDTKQVLTKYPVPGHDVGVLFGEQISFDDLLAEHELQFGPIRKFDGATFKDDGGRGQFHALWDSLDHEYLLYHKITLRIETALEALQEQSRH